MDKALFNQEYRFSVIKPYRDFSILSDRNKCDGNTFIFDSNNKVFDDLNIDLKIDGGWESLKVRPQDLKYSGTVLTLQPREDFKKKNTRYFYSDIDGIGMRIEIKPYSSTKNKFLTDNDKHIKNHYNKPFSEITTNTHIRKITLKGDKLSFYVFYGTKHKPINSKYFLESFHCEGVSINLKTGNFYVYTKTKKGKSIRLNDFNKLKLLTPGPLFIYSNRILSQTEERTYYNVSLGDHRTKTVIHQRIRDNFSNELNDVSFVEELKKIFKEYLNLTDEDINKRDWFIDGIVKFFINKKQIKIPNNGERMLTNWYPDAKYLKKNNNKLVSAVLDKLGVKSKQTIKLLHENTNIDIGRLKLLKRYFDGKNFHKYLGNLNHNIFIGHNEPAPHVSKEWYFYNVLPITDITEHERYCILKLLNEFVTNFHGVFETKSFSDGLESKINEIDDHLSMIRTIKPHFPDTKFNATNWVKFQEEHFKFSKLNTLIKKGYFIEYIFDEKLIKTIEEPIFFEDNKKTFYPIILKKDYEYYEEGSHMKHCVSSYVERETSLIISLREDSGDSELRVTCEYSTKYKTSIQKKHYCNTLPPEHFKEALNILDERILNYPDSIKCLEKVKTPINRESLETKLSIVSDNYVFELPF